MTLRKLAISSVSTCTVTQLRWVTVDMLRTISRITSYVGEVCPAQRVQSSHEETHEMPRRRPDFRVKSRAVEVDPERGERIRALREQAGRTQEEIAGLVGASPRVYIKWEKHGAPIRRRNLVQLAAVLGADVRDIEPSAPAVAPVDMPAAMADGALPDILETLRALEEQAESLAARVAAVEATLVDVLAALQQLVTEITQQRLEAQQPERREAGPGENRRAGGDTPAS
jgi:transcriptional regulator with XRE-family HTH domain